MKYLLYSLVLTIIIGTASCTGSRNAQSDYYNNNDDNYSSNQQDGPITYQQFYNDLSPYGNWVDYPQYGYVWIPNAPGFRPYYTNGHWIYTDYGWTWVSNYNWGWAPFHYGRWINAMGYGWMWVPGYEWAPAWVSWRGGGDYYGWAPLSPGMSINISIGSIPHNDWTFVPRRYINNPRINNYYVPPSRNVTIINNTTIINNNTTIINNGNNRIRPAYNPGPSVTEVESVTRTKIRKINVVESNKPGAAQINNNKIRVYRPAVKQDPANSTNIRPSRVTDIEQINRDNRNNNNNQPSPPVREIPKDQAPQINRNEPPVRRTPEITPDNNKTPERVLPNNPQTPQTNKDEAPVRTFPNNTETPPSQLNRDQQPQNEIRRNSQPVNNTPAETPQRNIERQNIPQQNNFPVNNPANQTQPVRKFDNSQKDPTNNYNTNSNTRNPNTIQNVPQQKPMVRNSSAIHQPNQRMAKGNKQINNKTPHHVVRTPHEEKKDKEKE